jgi:tetratricopeptide (TPR) repeat protein
MKLVLILMIKNEEKILKRCLDALVGIVDAFCICDTGSTDKTKEIALEFLKTHQGCFSEEPFKDFGYNRTVSFVNAKKYLIDSNWSLTDTYGLLLDADMIFVPGKLKQQHLTSEGYRIIQKNGNLEYYNARIIRMDFDWKCVGVTHEYWSGPSNASLEKDICFIDDKNDGGCKHDKFQRDARLLEQGLLDEPKNERYMFYLAQTYKCLGRHNESIDMYTKRIQAGGWAEEVWYSYYMIGDCYKSLNNISEFEKWMQLAYAYRPTRAESIYKLAEFFRTNSMHYKSYHYIKLGQTIPFPKNDVLFIESNIYEGLFDYEASIIEYYIHPEKGCRTSMNAMLKTYQHQPNIISNLKFYVKPLKATIEKLSLPSPFGENFNPSAISVCDYPMANVRYVNYLPPTTGNYITRDGSAIQTRNAYINLETKECLPMEEPIVKFQSHVKGLEDLRLYKKNNTLMFTATSFKEFIQDRVSIVHGEYDIQSNSYKNYQGIESPINSGCEKNWVHIPETDEFIYSWNPLRIGKICENKFHVSKEIQTSPFFNLLRGSAPPIEVNGTWWVLTHFVEYCQPRKYYHCFVELEKKTYKVLKVSIPFVFQKTGIEYCISVRLLANNILEYYTSFTDTNPSRVTSSLDSLEWIEISKPTPQFSKNIKESATTFVTALIDLEETRPEKKDILSYLNNFSALANTELPFHVFISSSFEKQFSEHYGSYKNIAYEILNLQDLEVYKELIDVQFSRPSVIVESSKQTTNYNKMNNSKIEFVKRAIDRNIYKTDQFAWIDFGIDYVIKNKETYKNLINTTLSSKGIVIPTIWNRSKERANDFNHINWRFAGGFFIGDKDSLIDFYTLYRKEFKNLISSKKVLPCEASVWAYFEEFFNWNIQEYTSDHNDTMLQIPKSMTANSTIVSMFFNLKKLPDSSDALRPIEFYLEHGKKTLELPYPMVLFCDEETRPLLEKIRGKMQTTYIEKNITEYDYFKELYPKVVKNRKIIPSPDSRNTSSYFLTSLFKFKALQLAKQGNYYPDTTHYFWIDLGGSHVMRGFPNAVYKVLDNPRPKISCGYIHYRPDSQLYPIKEFMKNGGKCCIGSGCFSVESIYIERYTKDIFEILNEQINLGVGHAEEQCMVYSYSRHPEWFNLYFADYYSLVTNYHRSIEDIQCIQTNFISNAKNAGKIDLVQLALNSLKC